MRSSPPDPLSLRERGNESHPPFPLSALRRGGQGVRTQRRGGQEVRTPQGTTGRGRRGKRWSWGEVAQRRRPLEVHVMDGVLVGGDDAVELGPGEGRARVHELDGTGDALFVAAAHQLERAARRLQAVVRRRDRRAGYNRGVVGGADLTHDPLLEIRSERAHTVDLEAGSRAAGRVPAAVEQVPRDDERRDPVVLARPEREVAALKAVVDGERETG